MSNKSRVHTFVSKLCRALRSEKHSSNAAAPSTTVSVNTVPLRLPPIPEISACYRDFYASLADDQRSDALQECLPMITTTPPSDSDSIYSSQGSTSTRTSDDWFHRSSSSDVEYRNMAMTFTAKAQIQPAALGQESTLLTHDTAKGKSVRFDDSPPSMIVIPEQLVTIVDEDTDEQFIRYVEHHPAVRKVMIITPKHDRQC